MARAFSPTQFENLILGRCPRLVWAGALPLKTFARVMPQYDARFLCDFWITHF